MVVVGEALVDLLPSTPATATLGDVAGSMQLTGRFGGSPANVAVGLARLDVPVGFAGRLARRGYGPWLRAHLQAEGVELDLSVDADEPPTMAVVTLDPSGVASYEFYGPDTADWAWLAHELPDPAALAGASVHTGSLATGLPPGAGVICKWLERLRQREDVTISYDPNIRPSMLGDADLANGVVAPVLSCAHLVKVSEEDLDVLHPGVGVEDVVGRWLSVRDASGPSLVVVTAGKAGATAWHRSGRVVQRTPPGVKLVDTVGAGDAFTAGLLSALEGRGLLTPAALTAITEPDIERALDRANLVAALTCGRAGADPPRLKDLARL